MNLKQSNQKKQNKTDYGYEKETILLQTCLVLKMSYE